MDTHPGSSKEVRVPVTAVCVFVSAVYPTPHHTSRKQSLATEGASLLLQLTELCRCRFISVELLLPLAV